MDETTNTTQETPQFGGSTMQDALEAVAASAEQAIAGESTGAEDTQTESTLKAEAEKQETPVQEEKFAAKFAALSRREKQIRQRETQLQQQMNDLQEKIKALESQQTEVQTFKSLPDRLKREPLKVLEEQGLTFENLAEMVLNDGKPTTDMLMSEYEKKFMSKMQELEEKLAQKEAKEQEERVNAAITQFQGQLTDFINQTPDYELIKANDSADVVFQVIEEHFNETGEILSNKEACDAVEEYLLEEAKKLVDREKVKKLLQPQTPQKTVASTGKSSPTLSNAQAAQASKSVTAKRLSDEESKAEAAKLIRWDD